MCITYRQNFGASELQYRDMYSACLLQNECTLLKHFLHSLFMCFLKVPEYMFINISVSLRYFCRQCLELISAFSELVPQAGQKREWCHWEFNRLQALESQVESLAHLKGVINAHTWREGLNFNLKEQIYLCGKIWIHVLLMWVCFIVYFN